MRDRVSLSEAVNSVRQELAQLRAAAKGAEVMFRPASVEVTFSLTGSTEVSGSAGIKWFVDFGVDTRSSSEIQHQIKFVLEPVEGTTGDTFLIEGDA